MPSDNVLGGLMKTLLRLNYAGKIKYSVKMFYSEMNYIPQQTAVRHRNEMLRCRRVSRPRF